MLKAESFSKFSYVLIPTATIILVIMITPLVFVPQWQKIMELDNSIGEEKKRYDQLVTKEKALKKVPATKLSGDLAEATLALPNGKDVPSLVVGLNKLAQDSGMSLEAIQLVVGKIATSSAKLAMTGETFDFKITLKGSPEQLEGFLNKAQSAKRVFLINEFEANSSVSDDNLITVTMSLSAPYEPLPLSMGSVVLPLPKTNPTHTEILAKIKKLTPYTYAVSSGPVGKENPFE
jgi:Tfp pilus assembly protein PilO